MRFDGYQANQAVINPVHDFIRFYLPATIAGISPDKVARMEPDEALFISQSLLGVRPEKDTYPMLRYLSGRPELGLKNVIVIQVEGLSQSLLHREEKGKAITPFLNDLSRRGLYFSNIVQNFNATDGAVFSTVTSTHKTLLNENWQYFLPMEVNGYFGSLPYLLGQKGYRHFAMGRKGRATKRPCQRSTKIISK